MPPAISSNSFASRLVPFFFAIVHLLYQTLSDRKRERSSIRLEPAFGDVPRRGQVVLAHISPRALGKAEEKYRVRLAAEQTFYEKWTTVFPPDKPPCIILLSTTHSL